jgi:serine/threonine protein kinase
LALIFALVIMTPPHLHRCPAMHEFFGTWQLASLIAVGGLGEIWRASRGDHVVALKRLHTHLVGNAEAQAQFTVEQRLTTQLPRHPNVVHAVEAGTASGRPYIALALAPGEDLRRLLDSHPSRFASLIDPHGGGPPPRRHSRRGPHPPRFASLIDPPTRGPHEPEGAAPPASVVLPRARVLSIVTAACEAAAYLHGHGFVHGDINPGNLVVATDDHITLIDLGVAREIGTGGVVRGTHAYMAPEQVRGDRWTSATDVFALGVVLWELASGARLFHRGPPWLSMAAVVEAPVPPLADPALDAIAQAALVKDPARRTASAAELAARLRDLEWPA